jgi:hypothetical protein
MSNPSGAQRNFDKMLHLAPEHAESVRGLAAEFDPRTGRVDD